MQPMPCPDGPVLRVSDAPSAVALPFAPSRVDTSRYQVVLSGVDTLVVSVLGQLRELVVQQLDTLQAQAIALRDARKGRRDSLTVATSWRLAGQPLLIAPHGGGKGQWKWLLRCPYARFDLGSGALGGIVCRVTLSSPFLWRFGASQAWAKVATLVSHWCDGVHAPITRPASTWDDEDWRERGPRFDGQRFAEGVRAQANVTFQVSELHLCADVAGLSADALDAEHFVHRGRVARWVHEDADVLSWMEREPHVDPLHSGAHRPVVDVVARYGERESLAFSRGAPHEAAIYNKPREIRYHSPDKLWFADLWRRNGWDGASPVTRVEMRYGREALHELGCESVDETFTRHDSLWGYSTREWLRHTVPVAGEPRRSSWPVSPWWRVVQSASFGHPHALPAQRERVRSFHEQRMLATILGYVESYTAWRGGPALSEPVDLTATLITILDASEQHYAERGTTFAGQVATKRQQIGYADKPKSKRGRKPKLTPPTAMSTAMSTVTQAV